MRLRRARSMRHAGRRSILVRCRLLTIRYVILPGKQMFAEETNANPPTIKLYNFNDSDDNSHWPHAPWTHHYKVFFTLEVKCRSYLVHVVELLSICCSMKIQYMFCQCQMLISSPSCTPLHHICNRGSSVSRLMEDCCFKFLVSRVGIRVFLNTVVL